MKLIAKNERPIGASGYDCFYSEQIVSETEKAFLVKLYFDSVGECSNRWLPKSKILAYQHTDDRDLIDNGRDYVKNPNYGNIRFQYFIPCFFTKDKGTMITMADVSRSYKDSTDRISDNDVIGVKGIDY